MTNPWSVALAAVIAEHYCCRAFRSRISGRKPVHVGLVGLEDDFEIAKRIVLYANDCVTAVCKREIKFDPKAPRGTYRGKCNAYGWGFVAGVTEAFQEQEKKHQEWGLVLVVPKAVDDSMQDMGKKSTFGKISDDHSDYNAMGYRDGRNFDPTHRVSAAPEQMAIGGFC